VTGPPAVLTPTTMATGSSVSSAISGNGAMTSPVAPLAVRLAPELVATQVPEPGTLALLGLGLVGLGLGRRGARGRAAGRRMTRRGLEGRGCRILPTT
jgi:hypothetical protein